MVDGHTLKKYNYLFLSTFLLNWDKNDPNMHIHNPFQISFLNTYNT